MSYPGAKCPSFMRELYVNNERIMNAMSKTETVALEPSSKVMGMCLGFNSVAVKSLSTFCMNFFLELKLGFVGLSLPVVR